LNKAIEVILEALKTKEQKIPPIPEYPDKSGKPVKKFFYNKDIFIFYL
jgi:hypothetical protein